MSSNPTNSQKMTSLFCPKSPCISSLFLYLCQQPWTCVLAPMMKNSTIFVFSLFFLLYMNLCFISLWLKSLLLPLSSPSAIIPEPPWETNSKAIFLSKHILAFLANSRNVSRAGYTHIWRGKYDKICWSHAIFASQMRLPSCRYVSERQREPEMKRKC